MEKLIRSFVRFTGDIPAAGIAVKRPRGVARARLTLAGVSAELAGSWRLASDTRSFVQFATDALGYRARRVAGIGSGTGRRTVRFNGTELTYRPNRGDVRAIAEVWLIEAYQLPFEICARNILDLGANIGAASVWLARRYGGSKLVAVEPVPENADLAQVNLARTGIDAEVITAAVGGTQGKARFELSEDSTWGRLGPDGIEVAIVAPQALVDRFPADERIDLVKIDIEGAEEQLFQTDLHWLERVDCLVVELHTDRVDWRGIIDALARVGFSYQQIAEGDLYCGLTDRMVVFQRRS